ncbi:MAG: hypothetical protein RL030_1743 [Pseudomonadota bacterium]
MQVSKVQQRGAVPFPAFTGERIYMREFTKAAGLPPDLRRWQDTVDAMLDGVDTSGPIFLMVDQAPVKAATTQRRPGLHVDGYWHPALQAHGGSTPPGHRGTPTPRGPTPGGGHSPRPPSHLHRGSDAEGLILASNVLGCAAYAGRFDGQPGDGGDCAHIDASGLLRVDMEPGRAWAGHTLTMLHEALPVRRDCLRTVVRLNVRGWCAA